jgi:XTP/dITP diphosphohydrolase
LKKIIFATGNEHKAEEVRAIFSDLDIEIITLKQLENPPEIIEDGSTFEENSLIKARTIFAKYRMPVLADDSGLEVDQLDGAPGIYSARYGGEEGNFKKNNEKLLEELSNFPKPHKARFVCVVSFIDESREITAEGELPGEIIDEYRGENGFGYDPLFVPVGYSKTLAEISSDEKNKISHRARAFEKMKKLL